MKRPLIYSLIVLILMVGCKGVKLPTDSDAEKYEEDLSRIRPGYDEPELLTDNAPEKDPADYSAITPDFDITEELNAVLDSVDILRKDVKYINGFTIQVYSGTDSEEARWARGKIYALIPGSDPELKFVEPNFVVKIGKYYSRMEIQKLYAQLKEKFPDAIIIPERIYIQ